MVTDTPHTTSSALSADRSQPPASPCVSVCELDAAGQLCIGCGRSLGEIGEWSAAGNARRWQICDTAAQRLARIASASSSSS
jgi:predicted Fe-S protein YdhL (DUF1289 family)